MSAPVPYSKGMKLDSFAEGTLLVLPTGKHAAVVTKTSKLGKVYKSMQFVSTGAGPVKPRAPVRKTACKGVNQATCATMGCTWVTTKTGSAYCRGSSKTADKVGRVAPAARAVVERVAPVVAVAAAPKGKRIVAKATGSLADSFSGYCSALEEASCKKNMGCTWRGGKVNKCARSFGAANVKGMERADAAVRGAQVRFRLKKAAVSSDDY